MIALPFVQLQKLKNKNKDGKQFCSDKINFAAARLPPSFIVASKAVRRSGLKTSAPQLRLQILVVGKTGGSTVPANVIFIASDLIVIFFPAVKEKLLVQKGHVRSYKSVFAAAGACARLFSDTK